jgi:hypothetical protein
MDWIDIRIRKPTAADADENGKVLQLMASGNIVSYAWNIPTGVIAWMPIPKFEKVELPEGYRLINTAEEPFNKNALWWNKKCRYWKPTFNRYNPSLTYCVPIETKPKYRPFKNENEFEPFKNEWTIHIETNTKYPPNRYNDSRWGGFDWQYAFDNYIFADGRPFGIKEDKNP